MYVPTINTSGLRDVAAFREALIRAQAVLRDFRARSKAETRTPELWNRFYQLQAEAVWLEDSLARIQSSAGSAGKRKAKGSGSVSAWERYKKQKQEEDEE